MGVNISNQIPSAFDGAGYRIQFKIQINDICRMLAHFILDLFHEYCFSASSDAENQLDLILIDQWFDQCKFMRALDHICHPGISIA
jgi:hypothetical protein